MGGSPSIPQRNLSKELSTLYGKGWPLQQANYNSFWQGEPLLSASHDFALKNLQNVGQLTGPLQSLMGQVPGLMQGYRADLGGDIGALGGYRSALQGDIGALSGYRSALGGDLGALTSLSNQLGALAPGLQRTMAGLVQPGTLAAPLQSMLGSLGGVYSSQIAPILNTGGALTPEQQRNVDQATAAGFAQRGNLMGNQALGSELLNRDQYRQTRFANALGQGLGISGEERGLTSGIQGLYSQDAATRMGLTGALGNLFGQQAGIAGQKAGITGQQAGITGQMAGITGQQAGITGQMAGLTQGQAGLLGAQAGLQGGLAQGIQGLQQGGLNQALGAEQAQIGSYASLMNPLLSYGQDVASSNQNAAAAQSVAGSNKTSGLIGGGASLLGAVAPALIGL